MVMDVEKSHTTSQPTARFILAYMSASDLKMMKSVVGH